MLASTAAAAGSGLATWRCCLLSPISRSWLSASSWVSFSAVITGRHARPRERRLQPDRLAAPVVIGAALGVAASLIPHGTAAPPPAGDAPVLDAQVAREVSSARPLVTRVTSVSSGMSYTVAAGDTLAGIAARACGAPGDWPAVWHQNQAEVPDPDLIYPGQVLRFTCAGEAAAQAPTAPATGQASAVVTGASGIYSCGALETLWEQAGG